ncbi:DnaT-like ssDNA-binding protein [Methylorubrum extorquens]|uniref:DnaT-like ssDNA-binding protein n=1 Tax=Methylorubrum extorquens TaxID=408 RepID=UPI002238B4D6|nr:DnaT-like ssDNA-binding protein [Methylorubrum extorquens]UYW33629.1 hypothetical protein OKB92_05985 [Methylorubrum extorquens]
MALVVETGAGLPDAESYASVEDANDYHQKRGNAGWAGDEAGKEAALRRATEYLDGAYRTRWLGQSAAPAQGLAWPRAYVRAERGYLASDAVPVAVVRACCEAALRELQAPGSLAPDLFPGERVVSETVGPLSVDYADGGGSDAGAPPVLVAVDRILAPVLRSPAAAGLVLRA